MYDVIGRMQEHCNNSDSSMATILFGFWKNSRKDMLSKFGIELLQHF